jgi:hypothetical protein
VPGSVAGIGAVAAGEALSGSGVPNASAGTVRTGASETAGSTLGLSCFATGFERMTTLRALGAVDTGLARANVEDPPELLPPSTSTPRTSTSPPRPPTPPTRSALETPTPTHIGPVMKAPHAIAVPTTLRTNEQFMLRRPRSSATRY